MKIDAEHVRARLHALPPERLKVIRDTNDAGAAIDAVLGGAGTAVDLQACAAALCEELALPLGVFTFGRAEAEIALKGQAIIQLVTNWDWVPRRLETVQLADHATSRRVVRLDIDLNKAAGAAFVPAGAYEPGQVLMVPLALLDRSGVHTTFEVTDSNGASLPRFDRETERRLVEFGLRLIFRQAHLHRGHADETMTAAELAIHNSVENVDWPLSGLPPVLADDSVMFDLIALLQRFVVLLTEVPRDHSGSRRVVTYSVREPLMPAVLDSARRGGPSRSGSLVKRLRQWVRGSGSYQLSFDAPSAGDCVSYHFEFLAPYDTHVDEAGLDVTFRGAGRNHDSTRRIGQDDRLQTMAHVSFRSGRNLVRDATFRARIHLIPTGLTRSAPFSALLTALTLLVVLIIAISRNDRWSLSGESGLDLEVAVALLAPGVFGTVLDGRGEHNFTSVLLWRTRITLYVANVSAFLAALAASLELSGAWAALTWTSTFLIATLAAVLLFSQLRILSKTEQRERSAQLKRDEVRVKRLTEHHGKVEQ